MISFILPRTQSNLHTYLSLKDNNNVNSKYATNVYLQEINEQINKMGYNWELLKRVYYPYEFLCELLLLTHNHIFLIRYAIHVEIFQFFKHLVPQKTPIKSVSFYENCRQNLCHVQYINNNNPGDVHINIEYNKNIDLSEHSSTVDYITVGSHCTWENDIRYARISYVSVLHTICLQKQGGSAILKLFNIDSPLSIGILTLLASLYKEVHITKPMTSDTNLSEIFIVCKTFLPNTMTHFYNTKLNIIRNLPDDINYGYEIFYVENITNLLFMNKINETANFFYQRQLDFIHVIVNSIVSQSIIKNNGSNITPDCKNKIFVALKYNTIKCLQWISQYTQFSISTEVNELTNNIMLSLLSKNS